MNNTALPLPDEIVYLCAACEQDGVRNCADLLVYWPKDGKPEPPMPLCRACFIRQIPEGFESLHNLSHGKDKDYNVNK